MIRKSIGTTVAQLLVSTLIVLTSTVSLFTSSAQAASVNSWIKGTTWSGDVESNGVKQFSISTTICPPQHCSDLPGAGIIQPFRGTLTINGTLKGTITGTVIGSPRPGPHISFRSSIGGCLYSGTIDPNRSTINNGERYCQTNGSTTTFQLTRN